MGRSVQLVNQLHEDIELANGAKTFGDLAQATAQLAGGVVVELQHRQQFPQTPRRDTGTVQR